VSAMKLDSAVRVEDFGLGALVLEVSRSCIPGIHKSTTAIGTVRLAFRSASGAEA
jgi:hypothetical protein